MVAEAPRLVLRKSDARISGDTMNDLSKDPVLNAVYNSIKRGIRVAIDNQCYGSAVILILSGIDTMAYLGMPPGHEDVTSKDFVKWAEKYITFPCDQKLTGLDLYGARCGMLHAYSTSSRLQRQGKCRHVGYMDRSVPEIRYNPAIDKDLVLVSVEALARSFFEGVDKFLVDLYSDPVKASVADERFRWVVLVYPTSELKEDSP